MKKLLRIVIILLLSLNTGYVLAQDDEEEKPRPLADPDAPMSQPPSSIHVFNIRVSGGIPNPLSSQLFRKSFIGIYEVNLSTNLRIGKYMFAGIGYRNGLFSVSNRTKFSNHTKLQMNSAYFNVGYDHYISGKTYNSFYLKAGYSFGRYSSVTEFVPTTQNLQMKAAFLQPTYSINFFVEERMTLGFYGGYNYMLWQFNPDQIKLSSTDPNVNKYRNSANSSYWIIGLEMYIGLGKRK